MNDFYLTFLLFIIYSFLGYLLEVVYCSFYSKKLVNRGFLFGPYCPIYGIGAILILLTLNRYYRDPIVVFVFGIIITSSIEYYTSYLLEKFFHNKWWDYSARRYNLNGRICLFNALAFGVGSCLIIYFIHPLVLNFLNNFQLHNLVLFSKILLFIFIIDIICSIMIAYNLRHRLIIAEELKAEKIKFIPTLLKKKYANEINRLKWATNRLINSFPIIKRDYDKELELIKNWVKEKNIKKKKSKKNK